jgi:hypothetical protein
MKVTGFSIIRNAVKYDYPIVEAIRSISPLCDNIIVAVGKSEDNTLDLIKSIDCSEKLTIVETIWDDKIRSGGQVLAIETDKAFQSIPNDSDWAFYIQGDEVVHERYLDTIYSAMNKNLGNREVDGLLFKYLHFYGSYDYVGTASRWYKNEIRVIRNDKSIYAYRDAQGFRKNNNEKLKVKPVDAYIYHYGWVKKPKTMQQKREYFEGLWHDDEYVKKNIALREEFDYHKIDSLVPFLDTHPAVMLDRIKSKNWQFNYDISKNRSAIKDVTKKFLENHFGISLGYKNYIISKMQTPCR